jgi:hypothetical protein
MYKTGGKAVVDRGQLEKRRVRRFKVSLPLRCQLRGSGEYKNGLTEDISVEGVGFLHEKHLPAKTEINLEMNVLQRVINSVGETVSATPLAHSPRYRIGIKFKELDVIQRNYLKDYLDTLREGVEESLSYGSRRD